MDSRARRRLRSKRHQGLALIPLFLVIVLLNPASAASPMSKSFSAPYLNAKISFIESGNRSTHCGSRLVTSPATVDNATGQFSLAIQATSHTRSCNFLETVYAFLKIPFRELRNGTRNVSSGWSLNWDAMATCKRCINSYAFVNALIFGVIFDRTNHTWLVPAGRGMYGYDMAVISSQNGTVSSSGPANVSLYGFWNLVRGHSYYFVGGVGTQAGASGMLSGAPTSGLASASFDFASPNGGTLNWVRIT